MKALERVMLNAAIIFGYTFFSTLAAGAMLYGVVEFQRSIAVGLIAAGLAFFTVLRRSDFGGGRGSGRKKKDNPGHHDGGESEGFNRDRLGMVI